MTESGNGSGGTLQTAIIKNGEELPCPAEKVIRQEQWGEDGLDGLVLWYEDTATEQGEDQ